MQFHIFVTVVKKTESREDYKAAYCQCILTGTTGRGSK